MNWLIDTLREYPSLAVFLTIGIGFYIGKLKFKSFSLGTVTSVLLVGVLVGQLNIPIPGPLKEVFFLLFLFCIGYSVGPQFFNSLRGNGLKQVFFAVCVCVMVLLSVWLTALMFGYGPGEAAGLFAGSSTISAAIGVSTDSINNLSASAADKKAWLDIIPVCYAVTYIYGTIGSAYILGNVGPMLLGGLKKVKQQTAELAAQMNESAVTNDPAYINANRPMVFRAYKVEDSKVVGDGKTISEIEKYMLDQGRRIFVERVRKANGTIVEPAPDVMVNVGDTVVLSGRREFIIQDEGWIGSEVDDAQLLSFPVEKVNVLLTSKNVKRGTTVDSLRSQKYMYGVVITRIQRGNVEVPVFAKTELHPGDTITISGLQREVDAAAPILGHVDKPSTQTDLIFVGLGIFIGGLIGAITIHLGGIPISLSTSGGALIAGLVFGWLRTKNPTYGHIPQSSVWLLNNLGLNMFIAVIGITSGPSFVSGLKAVGPMLFIAGIIATTLPLILGVILGAKVFKFHPAINLGCVAGSRTTTAALGAIEDNLGSPLPAMGYTVTYAVGNTLLILWGVVIILLMS
ncbi:MAG: aspartate-alanine antiporter [Muribaculaceae bacterium]|nr:aspartate-alanine antiporter [Muribaculaceae bacterium]